MIDLGELIAGEKPVPLLYVYRDWTGTIIDISGYAAIFQWKEEVADVPFQFPGSVTNGPGGEATYNWNGVEFASPGSYRGHLWVGNGAVRYASDKLQWRVLGGLGPPPNI